MDSIAITLAAVLSSLTVCMCRSGDTWTQMQVQCLTNATPVHSNRAFTERHCSMLASDAFPSGILVAQFRAASLQCDLFRYQSVCRQLLSGVSSDCRVLIRFPISYPSKLSSKLTNVWLGDDMTRLENVLCQADEETNRFYPIGVQWTEDGAAFDGSSSYLALNKSDIAFGSGVTVLLRMKRTPQVQALLESFECSRFLTGPKYDHFWEYDAVSKLFLVIKTQASAAPKLYLTTTAPLTQNASEWVNIGFTSTPSADVFGIFVGNSFLSSGSLQLATSSEYSLMPQLCFRFGKRLGDPRMFKGTVRVIAISNSSMSESEIRDFFTLVV